MTEDEGKQRAINSFNRQDVEKILSNANELKAWFEGKNPLAVTEAQILVNAIVNDAEEVLARLDL